MLVITISVLSFVGFCVLGYYVNDFRKKAIDCKIKYNSTKDFAEIAAKRILELEAIKSEMSAKIIEMDKLVTSYISTQENAFKADKSTSTTPRRNRGDK